ncbi:MAG: DUF5688 family protein [Lachnospiraceae bacterium]|nr:DUF5688 family protein [Lachnospiraceae bacterium]
MQAQCNRMKKDRAEFTDELCRRLSEMLGSEYCTEMSQVRKNNGVLKEVLHVRREDSECVPCFYMDELYLSYLRGESEPALAEHLANIVREECEKVKKSVEQYLNKELIMDRLFLRLVNLEKNKDFLESAVYTIFYDLAAVFYVLTEENDEGVKSFRMPKKVWDTLELGTAAEYFPRILENTERLFPAEVFRMDERLHVLSNRRKINGAAAILYPGVLKRLSDTFPGDFYIIPSSVHEVLLLEKSEECDAKQLNSIVCEVNEKQVLPEEVLSDHVYYYSKSKDCIFSMTD